jgi:hypothetical protein
VLAAISGMCRYRFMSLHHFIFDSVTSIPIPNQNTYRVLRFIHCHACLICRIQMIYFSSPVPLPVQLTSDTRAWIWSLIECDFLFSLFLWFLCDFLPHER